MPVSVYFVAYEATIREGISMLVPAGLYDPVNPRDGWSIIGSTTRGTECVVVSRNSLTLINSILVGLITTAADLSRVLPNNERNAVNNRMNTSLSAGATAGDAIFTVAGLRGNRLYVGADGRTWIARNPWALVEGGA